MDGRPVNAVAEPEITAREDRSATSLRSRSPSVAPSETETIINCNEPWDTFRSKVELLCNQIWPNAQKLEVDRIEGGAFNRIVAVDVVAAKPQARLRSFLGQKLQELRKKLLGCVSRSEAEKKTRIPLSSRSGRFILRIPRHIDEDEGPMLKNDEAALNFARRVVGIPVPEVLWVETGLDNPIAIWYMIQQRIAGTPLDEVWESLNHQQRLSVARQVGEVLEQLTSTRYPAAGKIDPGNPLRILALTGPNQVSNSSEAAEDGIHPVELIKERFEQWSGQPHGDWLPYRALAALVTQEAIGSDANYYFTHGDLYPRNILVEVVDEKNIRFNGILDWDNAHFAPAFVAKEPPCWLWKFDQLQSGFLEGPNLRIGAAESPELASDREIKQVFEWVVGDEWLKVAYQKDAEIYRWIYQFMREGVTYSTLLWLAEDAIEELTGAPYRNRIRRPTDGPASASNDAPDDGMDDDSIHSREERRGKAEGPKKLEQVAE